MQFLRIGSMIINMDKVLRVYDDRMRVKIVFENEFSITFTDEGSEQIRKYFRTIFTAETLPE